MEDRVSDVQRSSAAARPRKARLLKSKVHAAQRRLRLAAPGPTAHLTWAIKRRQGGRALTAVDALVTRGDAVVDVGANWGLYAARLAKLVGAHGQVDAFEPHPVHAGTLNALARARPQLRVHAMALASEAGTAELHVPIVAGRHVTALASLGVPAASVEHDVVAVPVDTLDATLSGRRGPSFVKIDVEGLELEVLRGGERTLRATRPTLLVEIEQRHLDTPIDDTFGYLRQLGYAGHFFRPDGVAPLEDFDVERDQLAYLTPAISEYGMPSAYVTDFLFADPARDVVRSIGARGRAA